MKYLGYVISADGLKPDLGKVRAIVDAPAPHDVQSLQSFLGLVNFYCRFIPNLSSLLHPLHALLRKDVPWVWSDECQQVFSTIKQQFLSSPCLVHYSNDLPLLLEVDTSPYGIGSCLYHVSESGEKLPLYFVSRSLTSAERNYSQIDREALAIIFSVKRLHQFLYGRHFVICTDHKPLLRILGPKVGLGGTVVARLQR